MSEVGAHERSPEESGTESVFEDDGESEDGFYLEDQGGLEEIGEFFSEARLQELIGTDDVESVAFLEIRINSEEIMMRDLGTKVPNLSELKLNNSNIPSLRDLGTSFKNLRVLWLSRSNVQELDGVSGLVAIRELYLAFNEIKDLSPMMGCDSLEVLDLEGNCIEDINEVNFLASCENLTALTLEGNPIANSSTYREEVCNFLPQIEMLDDIDKTHTGDEDVDWMSGGKDFAQNISTDIYKEEEIGSDEECGEHARPRTASKIPLSGMNEQEVEELMLVHQGIKHARTGFDDLDFVSLQDCEEQMLNRPGSAMPGSKPTRGSRPGSASFRPGSALGSGGSRGNPSPVESVESAESGDGRAVYRPGSGGSGGQPRPGTASSGASGRRPTSASISMGHACTARPGTSSMRPRTAALGFGPRPGTAGVRGARPSTASSSRPWTAAGRDVGEAWAFRRSARSSKGGHYDEDADVSSDLTYGAEEVYCGNLARGLRRRNVTQAAEKYESKESVFERLSCDEILAELRKWKDETINLALRPEDEDEPKEYKEGEIMGRGGGDQLILGEDDGEDVVRMGSGLNDDALGALGALSPPYVDDDEDDAEELLQRLQAQSERSWSRLGAAADAMDDMSSNSDTESQAPTARSSSASTVRAERAYTSKPPTVITTASAVLAHESAAEEHSPLSSPTSSGKLSDRYRRPSVAPKHAVTSDAEFGTVGSRRPTPTGIRVPTVRRRAPVDGASAAEVSTGAENTAPTGSDGKFARQIPRARTGGSSLAEFGTSSSVSAAAGLAGGGGGVQFGGANSLLGKMRGPIGGRNSPLLNSPLRAASPRIAAGGGEDGGQGIPNSIPFAVPTPPRAEAARPGSGVRRAPIRPVNMPLVSPASCSGGDE